MVESGVSTTGSVPRLDKLEDGHAGRRRVRKVDMIQQLALRRGEEVLTHCVVVAIPNGARGRTNPGGLTALSEGGRRVLPALIGVANGLRGTALALDLPNNGERTLRPLDRLDAVTRLVGGRVNPSKDARMLADDLQKNYPHRTKMANYMDPTIP